MAWKDAMPKPSPHILHWSEEKQIYELSTNGHLEQRFGSEGGSSWLRWLETHSSFSFQGLRGRLSVIREARPRGTGYWYAYRSRGRRTSKRYLGQVDNVTITRLEEVACAFTGEAPAIQTTQERRETVATRHAPVSLLLPKLLVPRLPSALVERPRLLQRLDAALERKLTLLMAPAGFGKTTVVNQWIAGHRTQSAFLPVAWVSLHAGDNDLFRFWRYVITACQTFRENLGQSALALLSEALQPPFAPSPPEAALTLLLNDLTQQVPGGLLILDDYHTIEEPRIHETMAFFLDHLPTTLHVLLLSRVEPPLPLLRWRARGELSELHSNDLHFSSEETATFLRQALLTQPSDAALQQLDTSLEGWAAGLRLLALTLQGQTHRREVEQYLVSLGSSSSTAHRHQPLLDYFITEVFSAQPEPLQRFLLQTSVLSRLNGPLCDAVTSREDSAALLEAVERAGLFLEVLDGEGGAWYRFHALFAEAMRKEAGHRLGEEALRALSLRASRWYEQHALIEEAIEAALRAHDFERAALLIEQVDVGGQTSELHTMRRWLSPMPEAVLRAHPMLCWLAALAL